MYLLVPYQRDTSANEPTRRLVIADAPGAQQLPGEFAPWRESECLGNHAIVLVQDDALRAQFELIAGVERLPRIPLGTTLAELTNAERVRIRDLIESLGYPRAEWQADLGTNLGQRTLRQVLRFILKRRRATRLDANGEIVLDAGDEIPEALPEPLIAGGAFGDGAALLDDFNRANVGPPPSANWTDNQTSGTTGGMVVNSNFLQGSATGALRQSYWSAATFGPDVRVWADIVTTSATGNDRWLDARLVQVPGATADGYRYKMWQRSGSDENELHRITNAVLTQLGADILQDMAIGDAMGLQIIGTTIEAFRRAGAGAWSSLGSRTDSTHTAAGNVGIGGWQSTATSGRWDNFSAETVSSTIAEGWGLST